jgi:hypothetical protein
MGGILGIEVIILAASPAIVLVRRGNLQHVNASLLHEPE